MATPSVRWVRFDGSPLEVAQGMAVENLHISPQFVLDVISGQTRADASMLAFRDPDTFVAGNIHACFSAWESIAKIAPFKLTPDILRWIQDCVDVRDCIKWKVLILLYPLVGSSLTPFRVNLLRSSSLTLFLTVCHLGLSPYGVRSMMSLLCIWLCL